MVARWGALNNITNVLNNRYRGTVFVRMGATGHLFNQHYLSVIFPLPQDQTFEAGGLAMNGLRELINASNKFLDAIVDVDDDMALRREATAMRILRPSPSPRQLFELKDVKSIKGEDEDMNVQKNEAGSIELLDNGIAVAGSTRDARGKSVRELSRLWKYLEGRSPQD